MERFALIRIIMIDWEQSGLFLFVLKMLLYTYDDSTTDLVQRVHAESLEMV